MPPKPTRSPRPTMPQMTESTMNTPGTDPIVELHDVRFSYDTGAHWTLDGIDLTIMPGERICLTGANGSGKSTLARLICGLAAPDSGTVQLLGMPVFTTADGRTPNPTGRPAAASARYSRNPKTRSSPPYSRTTWRSDQRILPYRTAKSASASTPPCARSDCSVNARPTRHA